MEHDHNQTSASTKKISNYVNLIVIIVVVISLASIVVAAYLYAINPNDLAPVAAYSIIGLVALAMSLFTFYQSRRQTTDMKIEIPKVMTTIQCTVKTCDVKTVREFQRGDYVYKELDVPCQKCSGKQMITAIYKEVKEKEKTYNV